MNSIVEKTPARAGTDKAVATPYLPNVKKPCAQCPFRKDTMKGWLGAERVTEIIEQDLFVCHKKTHLQCAGHMLIKGDDNQFVSLAGRLGIALELSGKELVFESDSDCIEHHASDKS